MAGPSTSTTTRRPCPLPDPLSTLARPAQVRAARADEQRFEQWLTHVLVRTDPFFAWLGVLFALVVVGQLLVPGGSTASNTLNLATTGLWALFLVDFVAKLVVAPRRRQFLRRHVLQLVMLLAPMLRVLSLVRLARLGRLLPVARVASASYRSVGTARQLVRTRVAYLAGVSSVAVVAIGELAYVVDGGRHGELHTLADALLWSAGTVIGMSPTFTPHSRLAQLVMVLGFVIGVVVVTALAGTLGSFLLDSRAERAADEVT